MTSMDTSCQSTRYFRRRWQLHNGCSGNCLWHWSRPSTELWRFVERLDVTLGLIISHSHPFSSAAPVLWKSLPTDIVLCICKSGFNERLALCKCDYY